MRKAFVILITVLALSFTMPAVAEEGRYQAIDIGRIKNFDVFNIFNTGPNVASMPSEAKDSSYTKAVAEGNTAFALDLYGKLKEKEGNLFFSPHSISTALAMTYAGARGNTEKQMAEVLHFTLDQKRLHSAFALLEAKLNSVQEKGGIELWSEPLKLDILC